jgi:hypothetical protein
MNRKRREVTRFEAKESIDGLFQAFEVSKVPGGMDDVIGKLTV